MGPGRQVTKPIVFIPPTEKPQEVLIAKDKSSDAEKSRRKFGNKVKSDLKGGRIFITPTPSPHSAQKLNQPKDDIFDNYISDVSIGAVRYRKERNPQDALANLFSVARGKGEENPK